MNIIEFLIGILQAVLRFFQKPIDMDLDTHKQKIYVKWPDGMVPIYLNPDWTIFDVKQSLSKKVNLSTDELRIIFCGKELNDEVKIEDCDVGEQSILHAVPFTKSSLAISAEKRSNTSNSHIEPLSLCLCPEAETQLLEGNDKANSRKPHFFVFCCHPCKSIKPGKLRVRCSTCKEGTLTLNRDPSCWDDVLVPGRISGMCQSRVCDGRVAEFYFKCTNHVTSPDDSVVALNLIRNNFKNIPCIVCIDISPQVLIFPCRDKHVICLECFCQYCTVHLNERKFIQDKTVGYTINCAAGCEDSLIVEPHHFKLLGDEQYSRYQKFGAEESLLQAGGVWCPRPNCGQGLLPDIECRKVTCPREGGCGYVFCRLCSQGYHLGPCEAPINQGKTDTFGNPIIDARAENSRWEEDSRSTIQKTTKPCPKCRTPTERDGGCMHMVCTRSQCGYHWCWICQEEWTRDCMGSHWFG